MSAICCHFVPLRGLYPEAKFPHDTTNLAAADHDILILQLVDDPAGTILASVLVKYGLNPRL